MNPCQHEPIPTRNPWYNKCRKCGLVYETEYYLWHKEKCDTSSMAKDWREYWKAKSSKTKTSSEEWDRKYDRGGASK